MKDEYRKIESIPEIPQFIFGKHVKKFYSGKIHENCFSPYTMSIRFTTPVLFSQFFQENKECETQSRQSQWNSIFQKLYELQRKSSFFPCWLRKFLIKHKASKLFGRSLHAWSSMIKLITRYASSSIYTMLPSDAIV